MHTIPMPYIYSVKLRYDDGHEEYHDVRDILHASINVIEDDIVQITEGDLKLFRLDDFLIKEIPFPNAKTISNKNNDFDNKLIVSSNKKNVERNFYNYIESLYLSKDKKSIYIKQNLYSHSLPLSYLTTNISYYNPLFMDEIVCINEECKSKNTKIHLNIHDENRATDLFRHIGRLRDNINRPHLYIKCPELIPLFSEVHVAANTACETVIKYAMMGRSFKTDQPEAIDFIKNVEMMRHNLLLNMVTPHEAIDQLSDLFARRKHDVHTKKASDYVRIFLKQCNHIVENGIYLPWEVTSDIENALFFTEAYQTYQECKVAIDSVSGMSP